ncbi:MAG TPA: NAD(P)/FAD-dependent oxidoreductase [Gillisia sp.]|nr:NAD(P)/FAD-dependent oxidoreductase [Gillisia sp.]
MDQPDVIIIGGGLAGLTAALHLASGKMRVRLYEKDTYPHHKVCGEYLSKEVIPYLTSLGVDINVCGPAKIDTLKYSDHEGKVLTTLLPLGGLGISRYELDHLLYRCVKAIGVEVCHETINGVEFKNDVFHVEHTTGVANCSFVLGAYGKRSLIDKKLNRDFISRKAGWLAVKGHYKNDNYPKNTVSLHNFSGGYCGLSKTETGAVNVCYLATYRSFKIFKNPEDFKVEVLSQNPHLQEFFRKSTPLFPKDLTIAQISFDKKKQVDGHVLMIGDAAGLIHPLCGNGMAMAIHSAKLASESILDNFNKGVFNRKNIERRYMKAWKKSFNSRIRIGRVLQWILLDPRLADISQKFIYRFPFILPFIIKRTHGKKII